MHLKNQRGQAMIEFAIIIPFFIFMLVGFVYLAFLCHDFLTLKEIARSAARTAAVGSMSNADIRSVYGQTGFFTDLYKLDSGSSQDFNIEERQETASSTSKMVVVTLTARRTIGSVKIMDLELSLPETIQTSLAMHKEE